jgi:Fe2+ or Zn2+ uptake regulation protein
MKTRATRQLATIYDTLAAATDHPTARQVFDRVRDRIPHLSLGTVYRNLEKLQQQGRARLLRLDGGVAHYDAMMQPHDHFVCEACGSVSDLRSRVRRADCADLEADGFQVRWQTTAIYGTCRNCAGAGAPLS